jgi:hypothetical protein
MNLSVSIPSRTASKLVPCVEAVRRHEPEARIVIVDDTQIFRFVHRRIGCRR